MPLTSNRPRVYYEDRGSGEPVLAITGFWLSSSMFDALVKSGEARLRWITYDHPGTGRSPAQPPAATTGQLTRAAVGVLEELHIEAANVLGISLGGAVALELALRAPERVRSLILISTSADGPLRRGIDMRRLGQATARVASESFKRRRLWLAPAMYSREYLARGVSGHAQRAARPPGLPPTVWTLLGQASAASLHSRANYLDRITIPTLVMHGDADALVPVANAQRLARGIRNAELRIVHGGSHAFALEDPDGVVTAISTWLRDRTRS
jgi:pimeloyl-ACP methyl ester carboxylesterase